MRVKITSQAVLQSELVPPDWYPCVVAKVEPDTSKEGKDMDWYILEVIEGTYKGKQFRNLVVEGGIGFQVNFFGALFNKVFKKDDPSFPEFESSEMVGRKLMVKTKRGEYNGKPQDQLEDFRPLVAASAQTAKV